MMIYTKNFKNLYMGGNALPFAEHASNKYLVKVTTFDGFTKYVSPGVSFFRTENTQDYALLKCLLPNVYRGNYLPTPGTTEPGVGTSITRGIVLGTGSTAATENDINLESPLRITVSQSVSRYMKVEDGTLSFISKVVITNTTADPVTFQEIGIYDGKSYKHPDTYNGSYGSQYYERYFAYLLARHVLDEPYTLEATNSVTLVFTLEIPVDPNDWADIPLTAIG